MMKSYARSLEIKHNYGLVEIVTKGSAVLVGRLQVPATQLVAGLQQA